MMARCHGSLDTHPGCYHPGPGVLPLWLSDTLEVAVFVIVIGIVLGALLWFTHTLDNL